MKIGLLLAAIAGSVISFGAVPNDIGVQDNELQRVQLQIKRVELEAKDLEFDKGRLLEQLKKLEKQYGVLVNAALELKTQIKQQQQALQVIREKIAATQKDMAKQKSGLHGLLKSAYAMGGKEGLKIILNQQNPALSSRMLVYYDYINQAKMAKLHAIEEDAILLKELEARKEIEGQMLQASLDRNQQDAKAMQAVRAEREQLLATFEQNYSVKIEQLEQLVYNERKLQAVVSSLQKQDDNEEAASDDDVRVNQQKHTTERPSPELDRAVGKAPAARSEPSNRPFAQLQGQLPWPVAGAVIERFGDPRFETTWDGVVINAKEGAEIRAVSDGRVVYADWLRGYGLMLIVDHGQGYMSLYAFGQSLHKSAGQRVKAGDVVASVGKTGGRSQASLYFGIRKKGRPVDPEQWCRRVGRS